MVDHVKDKSIINTRDNLSLDVFKSTLNIIGIDYADSIDTKSTFIDEKLLESRNKVAHGNKIDQDANQFSLSLTELKEVKDFVFFLMDNLLEDLIFFTENEFYLASNYSTLKDYLNSRTEHIRNNLP